MIPDDCDPLILIIAAGSDAKEPWQMEAWTHGRLTKGVSVRCSQAVDCKD